ncbi:MAG: Bax inhibitor-1/YccA family protein [Thermoguttaceae bacterium]
MNNFTNQPNSGFDATFAAPTDLFAAAASAEARSSFITKTYLYLAGAILALVGIEIALFQIVPVEQITQLMTGGKFSWLIVLGLFIGVSWIANSWALNSTNYGLQVAGLGLYVVAQSIILLPLLSMAYLILPPDEASKTILSAAITTAGLFAMLTIAVFATRTDFSFLRTFLVFGSLAALGFIVVAILFGFAVGPMFLYLMVALACGYILYDTSNVLHHYRIGQHVAASLALFASVMLLFWYILQIFLSRRD